ncbi:hypothetical protein [Shinella pollutisoli]|uniref:Uncharacterized protein n=1 Tax=Shinella pollutisoli TaxID=2250594 RepID=A0ABV7DFU0_9HYPH|nr:hypothetical protein [Shinella pollutisoli]
MENFSGLTEEPGLEPVSISAIGPGEIADMAKGPDLLSCALVNGRQERIWTIRFETIRPS